MSTSPSLPTVPRINNPEYPSVRWGRTVRSSARLGLNSGRSSRGCVIDTSLCLLIAEWADVALAILERRAAEQPCACPGGVGAAGQPPGQRAPLA